MLCLSKKENLYKNKKEKSSYLSKYIKNTLILKILSKYGSLISRAFFPALPEKRRVRGSLTVEAALVFPIIFLFFMGFFYYFQLMRFEMEVQKVFTETGKTWSIIMGCKEQGEDFLKEIIGVSVPSEAENIVAGVALSSYIYANSQDVLHDYFMEKNDIGGISQFQLLKSFYDAEDDKGTMVAQYYGNLPWLPAVFSSKEITQTGVFRGWVGKSIAEEEDVVYVYVAPFGTVYHLYEDCTYLVRVLHQYPISRLPSLKNKLGQSYSECTLCKDSVMVSKNYIYVTEYGERYHYDNNCSAITHGVQKIIFEEAGGYPLCSKCRQRQEANGE